MILTKIEEMNLNAGAIVVRDDYGTGAILPRIAGMDYRAESALRADSGTMKAFQQIVEKVDMDKVNVWRGDHPAVDRGRKTYPSPAWRSGTSEIKRRRADY